MANKETSETGTMQTLLDVDFWHGLVRAAPKPM